MDTIVEQNWIGTVDEVIEKVGGLKEQGFDHVNALHIAGDSIPEMMEQVESFAKDVMAKVRLMRRVLQLSGSGSVRSLGIEASPISSKGIEPRWSLTGAPGWL